MFASLKNKIREESGSDLSKLTSKIAFSTAQKIDNLRSKSQYGSSSSLNSIVSSADDFREDGPLDLEELRPRIAKNDIDLARKLDLKEHMWKEIVKEKDKKLQFLEKEQKEAHIQISNLKEALKNAEELNQQIFEQRGNSEQIESLQYQELLKVKHLVLEKDTELHEKNVALKECTSQLEKLRDEVNRLRRQEEMLSDVRDVSKADIKIVKKNLENIESEIEISDNEKSKLKLSVESEHRSNSSLRQIVIKLEKDLENERCNSLNVQKTLARVTSEKNTALLRNAEISQKMELVKQEMKQQEKEMKEVLNKLSLLEKENASLQTSKNVEKQLTSSISNLEDQLSEKKKTVKMLQLRLSDLKKTFQQELKAPNNSNYHSEILDYDPVEIIQPIDTPIKNFSSTLRKDDDEVNFKYLKHVVIRFLTSSEYEAQHLIKAISTLLKFTPEEEKLIQDTLEWKQSWFRSKPRISKGSKLYNFPR